MCNGYSRHTALSCFSPAAPRRQLSRDEDVNLFRQPLLPGIDLRLTPKAALRTDGRRASRLFRHVWDSLPPSVCRAVRNAWERKGNTSPVWLVEEARMPSPFTAGTFTRKTFGLQFLDLLDFAATAFTPHVIAHELAHAYREITARQGDHYDEELAADALARSWGYGLASGLMDLALEAAA
jgi:hypothetical protein